MVTNEERFETHRLLIEGAYMMRVFEGEELEDIVAVIIDPRDPALPEAVKDAFDLDDDTAMDMPVATGTAHAVRTLQLGVLLREPMIDLMVEIEPDIAHALGAPTRFSRAPCVVLAGGTASLHHLAIPALLWTPGGDA